MDDETLMDDECGQAERDNTIRHHRMCIEKAYLFSISWAVNYYHHGGCTVAYYQLVVH